VLDAADNRTSSGAAGGFSLPLQSPEPASYWKRAGMSPREREGRAARVGGRVVGQHRPGAMVASAEHLLAHGTLDPEATFLDGDLKRRAFTSD